MNDPILPRRLFHVKLLNDDVQKNNQDMFVAENITIGTSGVLECDRVFSDTPEILKVFYNGPFHIFQLDEEEIVEFNNPEDCGHHHEEDEE